MILGILPPQGGGLASLRAAGQEGRFVRSYLGHYTRRFEKVYYFSYLDEEVELPPNCILIKNPGFHRWLYAFLLPVFQRRYFRDCDVLRVMQMVGVLPALVAKWLYGTPYVGTYGYRYFEDARDRGMGLRGRLFEGRARLGLKWADGVILTTEELKEHVSPWVSPERLFHLPNGVDMELFRPLDQRLQAGISTIRKETRQSSSEKKVIFVGRLDPVKNLFLLLDALAMIREVQVKLVLVGEGELHHQLAEHAAWVNVAVDFLGTVPNERLPETLNCADLFVLPSLREGHPKALLEAMSCGLPCVGTDVPGIREIIQDGQTGLLAGLTKESLADRIRQVLAEPELAGRLGRQARRFIRDKYDLRVLLEQETQLLIDLARTARGGREPGRRKDRNA